jgi:putative FmdB family regulatory protein
MPIHDYHCRSCGADFELLVLAGRAPACKACNSPQVDRQAVALTAAPGKSQAVIAAGRRAAAREGHFSHYSKADRAKVR